VTPFGCAHPKIRKPGVWAARFGGGCCRSWFFLPAWRPYRSIRQDPCRGNPNFISTRRAEHFYSGAWGWFALTVMVALLAPLVEELFFRGLLLPRMRAVFGRGDWVANGTIFTAYHLHQPWSMPATLLDGIFAQAYPAKRFRSIWIGVVGHTLPSFVMIGIVLSRVLK
jgi:membrane protease YdiL (CAAX protease family)